MHKEYVFFQNFLKACFFLFQLLLSDFVRCQLAFHLRQIKFENPPIISIQMNWLVHDQLFLDEIDFRLDILDLRNNFTFRRSLRLPGATHKFLVVLVHTFRSYLSVFKLPGVTKRESGPYLVLPLQVSLALQSYFCNKEAFQDCSSSEVLRDNSSLSPSGFH